MSERQRFPCSTAGSVARGRRLLGVVFVGLAILLVLFAIPLWLAGQKVPALLALFAAFLCWTAWRMSGDLDAQWLEIASDRLVVQLRRRRVELPLFAPQGRELTADEVEYVAGLAHRGAVVAGSGGFDSKRLGEFNLYASRMDGLVLVDTGEIRLILSPDDPKAFLAALSGAEPSGSIDGP